MTTKPRYTVLKLEGKGNFTSANKVSVHFFDDYSAADAFITSVSCTGKHWVKAEFVDEGERVETGVEDMS